MNSRPVTYRINSSKLKTLLTSNHLEVDTDIVCCCRSFNMPSKVKAKDNNIFILTISSYVVQQPVQVWLVQTNKDSFVSIRKICNKFGSSTCLLLPQFHTVTGCDTVSYFFDVSKRVVFERTSSGIPPFNDS